MKIDEHWDCSQWPAGPTGPLVPAASTNRSVTQQQHHRSDGFREVDLGWSQTHSLADLLFLSTTNFSFNVNLRAEHYVPRVAAKSIKVNFIKFPFTAMKYKKKGGEL